MGHAWCKERSTKAQDSKSPLDRVFVRCAHRIYPSLKEEGSVLGGATQRVTSSEIGYAGSPPREILARGRSIDSVDRPFHPSDWVDVNLEVPGPPRPSSALTNSTVDASLYPASPTSSCSNMKSITPVPPPRRKRRNRGRPLPPKPDEIPESGDELSEGPLRSPARSPKTSDIDERDDDNAETRITGRICTEDAKHDGRKPKEIYEHKVNGTGRIISSDVVSGRRTSADKKTWRTSEPSHHQRKVLENEEYERFARSQSIKDSSTPNRQDRRKSKELEKRIRDSSRDDDRSEANTRTKNYSTVSLPNYDELDVSRHSAKTTRNERAGGEKMKSNRPVRSSTGSLPAESFLSPFSEKTSTRLEDYIPRRGSIEHLSPYQVLGKLGSSESEITDGGFMKYDPSKLEDWDLSDISNCDSNRRASAENLPRIEIYSDEPALRRPPSDVVDYSRNTETGEAETTEVEISHVRPDVILQKPEAFGKVPSPMFDEPFKYHDELLANQNSSLRYFEAPKMSEVSQASAACELAASPVHREPFFLDEELHRSVLDTIGGSCRNGAVVRESDRSTGQSRLIFGRSLSNESEPYDDPYESKELRAHSDVTSTLIRTISEESLPREMLEGVDEEVVVDFFDEGLLREARDGSPDQRARTPPPSPEPKIKARILSNDHSSLLKVLNDEAAADDSNLSSMTPSLTELEVALSDMLEKEDQPEENAKRGAEELFEARIVPAEKRNAFDDVMDRPNLDFMAERRTDQSVSLEQILGDSTPKTRKVSFCAWEEKVMTEVDLRNDEEPETRSGSMVGSESSLVGHLEIVEVNVKDSAKSATTGKPDRSFPDLDAFPDAVETSQQIPTPPRRRNKSSSVAKEPMKIAEGQNEEADPYPNDRLI